MDGLVEKVAEIVADGVGDEVSSYGIARAAIEAVFDWIVDRDVDWINLDDLATLRKQALG